MRLLHPIVVRPAGHVLLVRYRKEAAWLEAALYVWFVLCWYFPAIAYRGIEPRWLWWLWVSVPIVVIAGFYRQVIELSRRCRRGDEYAFDSAVGSFTHNGSRAVLFRNIEKVVFRTYLGEIRGHPHETYSLCLLLADGSKIQLTVLEQEKPVAELASQIADFLGRRVEKVYATVWDHHGESINSLDLTQRQLDSEVNSSESKR